jgi:hypothetical protein
LKFEKSNKAIKQQSNGGKSSSKTAIVAVLKKATSSCFPHLWLNKRMDIEYARRSGIAGKT